MRLTLHALARSRTEEKRLRRGRKESITSSLCPQAFLGAYEDFFSLTPLHPSEPEGCVDRWLKNRDCRGKARLGLGSWCKAVRGRQDADGRDWSKKSRNGFSVPWMEKEGGSASSFNSFCPVRSDPAWADERLRSLHVQCFLPANQTATRQHPDLAWSRAAGPSL
ncbi:uncharacterized protein LOC115030650 isoform X2 [Mus caroli]|uniref:Uncharacterized protein LOC115030650 isoform X2 n=1 Tax=Mus caroli TaxID=10089 RepID=A0A6P7QXD2_MUSCR|nr:uncharacterized protein LOC115030650 isoform X2 [Mus caroli]